MSRKKKSTSNGNEYQRAMQRALARKPFLKSDGKYLSRDEVHDREALREGK